MRIMIPVVIEMTDQQVADYALEYGLPRNGGKLMAREIVEDVRSSVLTMVQGSEAFGEPTGIDVSIKR
jgi:hypothetical protein